MAIFFHRRAATGGVDDDRVNARFEEGVDVAPGHHLRRDAFAVLSIQRATTDLVFGKYDFAAVAPQHAHRSFIDIAEQERHHAAVQHRDFGATRADRRRSTDIWLEETARDNGQH